MAGIEKEYVIPNMEKDMFKYIHSLPQNRWPELISLMFEGEANDSRGSYTYGSRIEKPKWQDCPRINICYQWLKHFGYKMSDEEEQMMDGTHQVFQAEVQDE